MKSKELRQKRAKLVEDARAIVDKDAPTAEETAKFDELMAEADKLKADIDRIERVEDAEANLRARRERRAGREGISLDETAEREEIENRAFGNYMRFGLAALNDDERKIMTDRMVEIKAAQGVGTGSAGGFTVPEGFYGQLIDAEKAYGGMLDVANVFETTSGNPLPIPTDNDTTNSGAILSENTQAGQQDVTFGAVNMGAYMYTSKIVLVSLQLLQDSAFNLDGFLSNKLGTRIARATNTHFTVGSGTNQPNGVVTAAVQGKVGANGQTTSVTYDDLVDLEHSVDPAYRRNARFMMADSSLKAVKKLKDSQNRPLWLPGIAERQPDTILGYPYTVNQDMPAMAASAKSIAFGDFSNYFIRRVVGVQLLRLAERYADYGQVGFVAFQRWDGNLIDAGTNPVKYYQNSAS